MKHKENQIPDYRMYPGRIKRLAPALERNGMSWEDALAFIASAKGITDQDKPAIGAWYAKHLPELEKRMAPEQYQAAMEACACCKGGERQRVAKEICASYATVAERLKALGQARIIIGSYIEPVDDKTFRVHFFPEGWGGGVYRCSCLQYGPGEQKEPMPVGYCMCCGGHIKGHCETALGVRLSERIVSSALTTCGREGCVIELHMLDEE